MTLASIAKLSVRFVSAWFALVVLPPPIDLGISSLAHNGWRMSGISDVHLVIVCGFMLLTLAAPVVGWCAAGWLCRYLIPAGMSREQSSDYARWQNLGLMVIGGWLLCASVKDLSAGMLYAASVGGLPSMFLYHLIAGVLLVIGLQYRKRQTD